MTVVALSEPNGVGVRINDVILGERARKDLGDLSDLEASINDLGLLHPIVVTRHNVLIAGHRRLDACRRLGWEAVPVTVAENISDVIDMLAAERDENTCRLDMKPSEKVALVEAIRELKQREAKDRQGTRTDLQPLENFTGSSKEHSVRDQLGAAVGMSGPTYDRARQVVKATEHDDPEVRQVAEQARDEMDRTGKVTPAFDKVAEATGRKTAYDGKAKKRAEAKLDRTRQGTADRAERIRSMAGSGYSKPQIAAALGVTATAVWRIARAAGITIPADQAMGRSRKIDSNRIMRETVAMFDGLELALNLVNYDELDHAEITNWTVSLSYSIRVLNRLNKQLKEMVQ